MEKKHVRFSLWYVIFALWGVFLLNNYLTTMYGPRPLPYSEFLKKLEAGKVIEVAIDQNTISGKARFDETPKDGGQPEEVVRDFYTLRVENELAAKLEERGVVFRGRPQSTWLRDILGWVVPILLFGGLWYFLISRMNPGQQFMAFGGNKAKVFAEKDIETRFGDVAGADEAKAELQEIIDFLREPERYGAVGGRMPKGVLLVGPPGTGKTLLARAVAGEAGVPFFSISGSEFVEMFVGVGASRVRELFNQAREKAPCIIFIDELDAIGKSRSAMNLGGHDEREQTLNQLLVEMDGFDPRIGVVIMAATNRPETLDPALLRAGRFDRQVLVDRPDLAGREAILKVHAKKIKLAPDIDLKVIAQRTPGFSGADLANILNEAALLAVRHGKSAVDMPELEEAIDRVVAGLQKKNRVINPAEKRVVAFHETGHALVAAFTSGSDKVHKITIVPRGVAALGYTQQLPTEERYLMTRQELFGKIDVLLGGRMAEEIVFGEVSTGAHNDLQRATDIGRAMLAEYGMGETLGLATFPRTPYPAFLGQDGMSRPKEYSEATAARLDEELIKLLESRADAVRRLLMDKRAMLDSVSEELLKTETIDEARFLELIGQTPRTPEASEADKAEQSAAQAA